MDTPLFPWWSVECTFIFISLKHVFPPTAAIHKTTQGLSTKANAHAQEQTTATTFDLYQSNFFKSNLYFNLLPSNHVNLESPSAPVFPVDINAADASTIVLPLPGKSRAGWTEGLTWRVSVLAEWGQSGVETAKVKNLPVLENTYWMWEAVHNCREEFFFTKIWFMPLHFRHLFLGQNRHQKSTRKY